MGEDPVRYVPTSGETEDGRDEVKGAVALAVEAASEADPNKVVERRKHQSLKALGRIDTSKAANPYHDQAVISSLTSTDNPVIKHM